MHLSEDVLDCEEIINSELRFLKPHHRKPFNIDLEKQSLHDGIFHQNFLKLALEFLYFLCINSIYFLDLFIQNFFLPPNPRIKKIYTPACAVKPGIQLFDWW